MPKLDLRIRSRQRQLQRLLGDAGAVLPYEASPTSDLPAAGWYIRPAEPVLPVVLELELWRCGNGNALAFIGGDFARAAGNITLIVRRLDAT